MSAALVRQALELVDPDVCGGKKKKRGSGAKRPGQELSKVLKAKDKPKRALSHSEESKTSGGVPQGVIDKLLKLSKPVADKKTAKKIAKRVTKGRPVIDTVKVKKQPQKSILFPDD